MTIQLPVIIWTVICFSALYLILKYLLFKPVISFIDKRNEKIEAFDNRQKEIELENEQRKLEQAAEREKLILESEKRAKEEVEKIQAEGKRMLEDAKKERLVVIEDHRRKTELELSSDIKKADGMLDNTTDLFFSRLFTE